MAFSYPYLAAKPENKRTTKSIIINKLKNPRSNILEKEGKLANALHSYVDSS